MMTSLKKFERPLSVFDLNITVSKDEPRIRDVRIGERLGMAQPLNIRKTVEKNWAELEQYGSIHAARELIETGKGARRSVEEYWLNEAQSLLLCMFSRTDKAAKVRKEVVEVYLVARHGRITPTERTALPKSVCFRDVEIAIIDRDAATGQPPGPLFNDLRYEEAS